MITTQGQGDIDADALQFRFPQQTGLRLSIVKSIAELHCGSIPIDSAFGKGATYLMGFPAPTPAAA
jgi:signal transduction histidine kinase